jgi:UDP-N-acetylglucosamine 2-epimerase
MILIHFLFLQLQKFQKKIYRLFPIEQTKILYSEEFIINLPSVVNPYGEGGASSKIVKHLRETSLEKIVKKSFHDL